MIMDTLGELVLIQCSCGTSRKGVYLTRLCQGFMQVKLNKDDLSFLC